MKFITYIIFVLFLVSCKETYAPIAYSYNINGKVKMVQTNEPISGVELYAYVNSGLNGTNVLASAYSDSNGNFELRFESSEESLQLGINEPEHLKTDKIYDNFKQEISSNDLMPATANTWSIYLLPTAWINVSLKNDFQQHFDHAWLKGQYNQRRIPKSLIDSTHLVFKVDGLVDDSIHLELFSKSLTNGDSSIYSSWHKFNAPAFDTLELEISY